MKFKNRKLYFNIVYKFIEELFLELKKEDTIYNVYLIETIVEISLDYIEIIQTEGKEFWSLELESKLMNLI